MLSKLINTLCCDYSFKELVKRNDNTTLVYLPDKSLMPSLPAKFKGLVFVYEDKTESLDLYLPYCGKLQREFELILSLKNYDKELAAKLTEKEVKALINKALKDFSDLVDKVNKSISDSEAKIDGIVENARISIGAAVKNNQAAIDNVYATLNELSLGFHLSGDSAYPALRDAQKEMDKIKDNSIILVVNDKNQENNGYYVKNNKELNKTLYQPSSKYDLSVATQYTDYQYYLESINGILTKTREMKHKYILHILKDIHIIGTDPLKLYKLSRFVISPSSTDDNKMTLGFQIHETDAPSLENEGTADFTVLGNFYVDVSIGEGIKEFYAHSKENTTRMTTKLLVSVDTNKIPEDENGYYNSIIDSNTYYCWMIKPSRYTNKPTQYTNHYLYYMESINGIATKSKEMKHKYITDILKDIYILGADPTKMYKLGRFVISPSSANSSKMTLRFEIWETDASIINNEGKANFIRTENYYVDINIGEGVKEFYVLSHVNNINMYTELLVSIDTDKIPKNENGWFNSIFDVNTYYCWMIKPSRYVHKGNTRKALTFYANAMEGTNKLVDNLYSSTPEEELLNAIGSHKYKDSQKSNTLGGVDGFTYFTFPTINNTFGSILSTEVYANVFRIPFSSCITQSNNGLILPRFFEANRVSPYGILRIKSVTGSTLFNTIKGRLEVLIKVPDISTREIYDLALYIPSQSKIDSQQRKYLCTSYPLGRDRPFYLDQEDFTSYSTYLKDYSKEEIRKWLDGAWQKVIFDFSIPTEIYPNSVYTLSIYRKTIRGTEPTERDITSTDLIILNGFMQIDHEINTTINENYLYNFKGMI